LETNLRISGPAILMEGHDAAFPEIVHTCYQRWLSWMVWLA